MTDQRSNQNREFVKEPAEKEHIVLIPYNSSYGNQEDYDFENDRYGSGKLNVILRNSISKSVTKNNQNCL